MGEYINTYVVQDAKAYRVAFRRSTMHPMICMRKTKHGEAPVKMGGRVGKRVIAAGREQVVSNAD